MSGFSPCPKPKPKAPAEPKRPVRSRPPAQNVKRRSKEWLRAYGSIERVLWVKAQPSCVSGLGPCVNAHVRTGGTSRKADACWIVPLTDEEHQRLHSVGREQFEREHGVNLDALAIETQRIWEQFGD
jgi:hypothetical protein